MDGTTLHTAPSGTFSPNTNAASFRIKLHLRNTTYNFLMPNVKQNLYKKTTCVSSLLGAAAGFQF